MRVALVVAAAVLVCACAAIVDLDQSDPVQGESASTSGDTQSSGGTSGSSATTSGASGTSGVGSTSGASSGTSTSSSGAADSGKKPIPETCNQKEDCPQDDEDHDSCDGKNHCVKECIPAGLACEFIPTSCCVGFECRREEDGPPFKTCLPKDDDE